MTYQYQELQAGEIRLLKPCSDGRPGLCFTLSHVPTAASPKYAALSYTWGAPDPGNAKINVDGQNIDAGQNLIDALQQLYRGRHVNQYLWVDAICINQATTPEALAERASQIALMRQIFEQADKVLVWLGIPPDAVNNKLAFEMMRSFEKKYRKALLKARPWRPFSKPVKQRNLAEDINAFLVSLVPDKDKTIWDEDPLSNTNRAWKGLLAVWQKPWWTRTWILQEASIPEPFTSKFISGVGVQRNNSKVHLLCGDEVVDWSDIGATWLAAQAVLKPPAMANLAYQAGMALPMESVVKFRARRIADRLGSFLETLQAFRLSQCLDSRDKVYAPLCLADEEVRQCIRPSYLDTTRVVDVYMDVVRYCLTLPTGYLDFLGHAVLNETKQSVTDLTGSPSVIPSWVPNWAARTDIKAVPKKLYIAAEKKINYIYTVVDIEALSHTTPCFSPLSNLSVYPTPPAISGTSLLLRGVPIDTIADKIPNNGPDLAKVRAVGQQKGAEWAALCERTYPLTCETFQSALLRTIVMDLTYDDYARPCQRGGNVDFTLTRKARAEMKDAAEYQRQRNMIAAKDMANDMRDLGLMQGKLLGMVPNVAEIGDEIWAFEGGAVLYVLRAVTGLMSASGADRGTRRMMRYVGECYVHGMMDGEVAKRVERGEMHMEEIALV